MSLASQRNTAQNLLLEQELCAIARGFEEAGIELLVLKGVPLTRRLHGDLCKRYSVDNDLLVRRADVLRAERLLTGLGYSAPPGRELSADLASTFEHPMRRSAPGGALLRAELHWQAFPPEFFQVPESVLWQHAVPFQLHEQRLLVFDEVMTLLHLASHHVQHRCAEAKVLDDVGAAWSRFAPSVDVRELTELAARFGMTSALAFALDAAFRAGSANAPSPVRSWRARLIGRYLPPARFGADPSYASIFGSVLLASPPRIGGALLRELFPHPAVLARIYGVERDSKLLLRYPLRLLRPAQRWFKLAQRAPRR